MVSPLMAKLALALHLGLRVPPECAVLKNSGGVRGPIDSSLERGEGLGVYDPPTVMVTMGFWLYGLSWVKVFQSMGFSHDLWRAYDELVAILPDEYVAEQARRARPGQQLAFF